MLGKTGVTLASTQTDMTLPRLHPPRRSRTPRRPAPYHSLARGARRSRQKFLRIFPRGFYDETYLEWERDYKWEAHQRWEAQLGRDMFTKLLDERCYADVAARAVRIESRTNLLFSFEKMALRDATRTPAGAKAFATGLYRFLYGASSDAERFGEWCDVVASLPRVQTRVLTWPVVTVFGFLALPRLHFFVKPNVTRAAADAYEHALAYESRPSWRVYARILAFASAVRRDLADLRPRDMIDIQSFLWVQGSDEYTE